MPLIGLNHRAANGRQIDGGLKGDCPAPSSLIVPPPHTESFISGGGSRRSHYTERMEAGVEKAIQGCISLCLCSAVWMQ